jgi:predicted amidophosphoribosyltransferase
MDNYESYYDGTSDCCSAPMNTDIERCSRCGENCEAQKEENHALWANEGTNYPPGFNELTDL